MNSSNVDHIKDAIFKSDFSNAWYLEIKWLVNCIILYIHKERLANKQITTWTYLKKMVQKSSILRTP